MKKALVLGVCLCCVAGAYAGNTQPVDLTYPDVSPELPVNNPTGVSAAQAVSMHIRAVGTSLQYATAILDDDGTDRLYLKVQQQSSNGMFSHIGFYHLEGSSISGLTGGLAFHTLTTQFSEADMLCEHDGAGNIRMTFTNLVPSSPDQVHERGGWVPRNGDGMGIAGFTGIAAMDDFSILVDGVCDDFNRADGPLGPDWQLMAGGDTGVVTGNEAYVGSGNVRARYQFVGECGGPACNYTVKKSKSKKGCDSCPAKGSDMSSGEACEDVGDCAKKIKGNIECPNGGNGFCKIKAKRSSCG